MNWLKKLFAHDTSEQAKLPAISAGQLRTVVSIPEPTRSLLWGTNEDTAKIESPMSIRLNISITPTGVESTIDDGKNFFGEPSLIWTKLPVKQNNDLEEQPMYYPAYSRLSPEHRYQYLKWLTDITQPTNLSYVFLYFYGLERHLLAGDFDGAASEIARLLRFHDKSTFRSYAQDSLITAAIYRKRLDIFEDNQAFLDGVSNEALFIKAHLGWKLAPEDIIALASQVGFTNRRYIKMRPALFATALENAVAAFERERGPVLHAVPLDSLEFHESIEFANLSLPDRVRHVPIPQLLPDERFRTLLRTLLEQAHASVKETVQKRRRRA